LIIICHTDYPVPIGHVGNGTINVPPNRDRVLVAVKILDKATYDDYIDFCKEQNALHLVDSPFLDGAHFFYKVEVLD